MARKHDGGAADGQKHRRESDDREIRARPVDAETFTGPKHAERRQHDTDSEFERIFGTPRQRPMHDQAGRSDQKTRRNGADAGGNEFAAAATERNHDEHDFKSFEKYRLEGRDSANPVEPRFVAAGPPPAR